MKNFISPVKCFLLLSLAALLLLSGCGSVEAGAWLPEIQVQEIERFIVSGSQTTARYNEDRKIKAMLELFSCFPHASKEAAEPPENAVQVTMRMKEGEHFEFAVDEYGIYADGYAYTSSDPYFGLLTKSVSAEERVIGELSLETRPFSEVLEPLSSETVQLRMDILADEEIERDDGEVFDAVIKLLGDLPYYYRLPVADSPGISRYGLEHVGLVSAEGEITNIGFSDFLIECDEMYYFGPFTFEEVQTSLRECLLEHGFE